ncbi:heparinase II/III family protein [Vibrio breoganii]
MINRVFLLFNTVRHLKFTQIYYRLFKNKPRNIRRDDYDINTNESLSNLLTIELSPSRLVKKNVFIFLNEKRELVSWNDVSAPKLWLYNLHYFDEINSFGSDSRKAIYLDLINDWIENNPPFIGNGWEPYPLSLRIVNWIKYFNRTKIGDKNTKFLNSLYLQSRCLYNSLEYHLLGNHLFANAKALIFAGSYFTSNESIKWLNKGLEILDKEIPEQILEDGANFELSPMYHAIILNDMLDLCSLCKAANISALNARLSYWSEITRKMFAWAEYMLHPDGEVSFFNDSAIGIAPKLASLKEYALYIDFALPSPTDYRALLLENSGYIVAKKNSQKLIIDSAKVGPDYIPGHAHADTLSFELSIGNQRVFVNSGTSVYGLGEERLRQRKTESHNTVVVNGEDSSEVWSGFRVARRAYPSSPTITHDEETIIVRCSHDGYMRLSGKVMHTRTWHLASERMIVSDLLTGTFNDAKAHYHLHPNIQILSEDDIIIQLPDNSKYGVKVEGGDVVVLDSTWHPEFGLSVANKKFLVNFKQNEVTFVLERIM